MTQDTPIKVIQEGPRVNAKEWALRTADNIAERHMHDAPFSVRASLAKDIAENLQSVFDMQELARTFNRAEDKRTSQASDPLLCEMAEEIQRFEWRFGPWSGECPRCRMSDLKGHGPGCRIASLLKAYEMREFKG